MGGKRKELECLTHAPSACTKLQQTDIALTNAVQQMGRAGRGERRGFVWCALTGEAFRQLEPFKAPVYSSMGDALEALAAKSLQFDALRSVAPGTRMKWLPCGMNRVAVRKSHNLLLNAGVLDASANALNIRGVTMSNLQIDVNFASAAVALLEVGLKHTAKEVRKLVVLGSAGRDYNKLRQAKLSEDALADLVAIPGGDDAEVLLHMLDNDQPVGVRRKNFDRLREGFHNAMRKLSVRQRGMGQEHFSVTTTVPGAEMQLHGVDAISGLVFYKDSLGTMAVLDPRSRATLAPPRRLFYANLTEFEDAGLVGVHWKLGGVCAAVSANEAAAAPPAPVPANGTAAAPPPASARGKAAAPPAPPQAAQATLLLSAPAPPPPPGALAQPLAALWEPRAEQPPPPLSPPPSPFPSPPPSPPAQPRNEPPPPPPPAQPHTEPPPPPPPAQPRAEPPPPPPPAQPLPLSYDLTMYTCFHCKCVKLWSEFVRKSQSVHFCGNRKCETCQASGINW